VGGISRDYIRGGGTAKEVGGISWDYIGDTAKEVGGHLF
jgi:hypothetical protein